MEKLLLGIFAQLGHSVAVAFVGTELLVESAHFVLLLLCQRILPELGENNRTHSLDCPLKLNTLWATWDWSLLMLSFEEVTAQQSEYQTLRPVWQSTL